MFAMSCQKLVYEYIYTYRAHWSDPVQRFTVCSLLG